MLRYLIDKSLQGRKLHSKCSLTRWASREIDKVEYHSITSDLCTVAFKCSRNFVPDSTKMAISD
jgi:hypothetical protein